VAAAASGFCCSSGCGIRAALERRKGNIAIASKEYQVLEGGSAERNALLRQVGNYFGGHATTRNVGVFETGVSHEAGSQGLCAQGI